MRSAPSSSRCWQKKQQLKASDMTPEQQKKLIDQAGEIARQTERNNAAQDVHNKL
jgi:hypothetical protein